jgi:hypothetical protein
MTTTLTADAPAFLPPKIALGEPRLLPLNPFFVPQPSTIPLAVSQMTSISWPGKPSVHPLSLCSSPTAFRVVSSMTAPGP